MLKQEELSFFKCSKNELLRINKLAHVIWPQTFKPILTDMQIAYMLDWMYKVEKLEKQYDNGHLFFLVKYLETDIGFVGLQPNFPEKNKLRIHKIYLDPDYHGKKIGKWMMDQIEILAVQLSQQFLQLNVNRHNKAVQFYQQNGFTILHSEDLDIGHGFYMNDFVMEKKL